MRTIYNLNRIYENTVESSTSEREEYGAFDWIPEIIAAGM
jgi:hypothetical protein